MAVRPIQAVWRDVTVGKMYVTGGIGNSAHNEGFTADYDLPNASAYAETCAAIGLVFWNHRLLQLECDGRYADAMERFGSDRPDTRFGLELIELGESLAETSLVTLTGTGGSGRG